MGFLPGFVLRPEGWQLPNGREMSGAHCKTGSVHFPKSVLALTLEAQPHGFLVCAFDGMVPSLRFLFAAGG